MKIVELIREDIKTVFAKDPAAKSVWEVTFLYPGLHAVWLHRLANFLFCTPRRSEILEAQLKPGSYHIVSSQDIGLSLGIRALAVERKALPKGVPFETGGEVVKIMSPNSVVWADAPHRFEAGTPSIVNVIAFAKALKVIQRLGNDGFKGQGHGVTTSTEILYQDELRGYSGKELLLKLRKALVGRDIRVPTAEGEKPYINLDNGASTPTFSPIWDVVRQTWRQPEHVRREIVCEVKEILAEFLGAPLEEYDIIFASNTTEALNITAQSLGSESGESEEDAEPVVLNTLLEHHSNELPWRYTPGVSLIRLPVDDEGFVDLDELEGIASAPRSLANRLIAFTHNGTPFLPHTEVQDQMRDFTAARSTEVYSFGQDDLLNEEVICWTVTEMPNQAILSQVESLRRSLYSARRM